MSLFLNLPPEILHAILQDAGPESLGPVALSCMTLHKFISNNKALFKDIYLQLFDEPCIPKDREASLKFDWESSISQYLRMSKVLLSADGNERLKITHVRWIAEIVTAMLKISSPTLPSRTVELLNSFFKGNMLNQRIFLSQSTTFFRMRCRDDTVLSVSNEDRGYSAQLHCLYGNFIEIPQFRIWGNPYPYAASMVYDLRNYNDHTFWGPFLDTGTASVDWEKVEAVMIVLGSNLRWFTGDVRSLLDPIWNKTWSGITPNSFTPLISHPDPEKPLSPLDSEDPYNISGTWMRVVCFLGNVHPNSLPYESERLGFAKETLSKLFMLTHSLSDFNDLFEYNFLSPRLDPEIPRPPINSTEAVRLIVLEIRVTKIASPDEQDDQDSPVVHFRGKSIISRSRHTTWDPNSTSSLIRGTVRTTAEGEVRWTTLSVYGGQERWKSEGVQVGGRNSARGVYGHWFDKDLDEHGPAGPTAFWKLSNNIFVEGEDGRAVRDLFFPDEADDSGSDFTIEAEGDEHLSESDETNDEHEHDDGNKGDVAVEA